MLNKSNIIQTYLPGGTQKYIFNVHSQLLSIKAARKSAKTKTAVVKARAYIVCVDRKTTVYRVEACEIAFFENTSFTCP